MFNSLLYIHKKILLELHSNDIASPDLDKI